MECTAPYVGQPWAQTKDSDIFGIIARSACLAAPQRHGPGGAGGPAGHGAQRAGKAPVSAPVAGTGRQHLQGGLTKRPALTRADVEAFAANGGTAGRYLSAKVPFAYDYYGKDGDVSTSDGHGSHVTALAAGYVPGP